MSRPTPEEDARTREREQRIWALRYAALDVNMAAKALAEAQGSYENALRRLAEANEALSSLDRI